MAHDFDEFLAGLPPERRAAVEAEAHRMSVEISQERRAMTDKRRKPIVAIDFDGVIHGYQSGWKGAHIIPDQPVAGALEALVRRLDAGFEVAIHSSRSRSFLGRRAMRRWLRRHLVGLGLDYDRAPAWWLARISQTAFADPWSDEVRWAAERVVREIKWPRFKPPALVTIDDRALTFTGRWGDFTPERLRVFQPWNKRLDQIELPSDPILPLATPAKIGIGRSGRLSG